MNEIDFTVWLKSNGTSNKVCSDYVSRLKRVERSLIDCDLDEEFEKDRCQYILSLFAQTGKNEEMKKRLIGDLPIGKYYLSAFSYAIRKYVAFKEDLVLSTQE
jgi:hypothetical protein